MEVNSIATILEYSRRIKNSRCFHSVYIAMNDELTELDEEVVRHINGVTEGDDGVLGEGIDAILCIVDLIYQQNPNITAEDIHAKMIQKLDKWELKYGNA